MNAANDTRGHSAANPGLRGHSCGEHYPLTITGSPSGWRVFNCKSGVESEPFNSYGLAAVALQAIYKVQILWRQRWQA